MALDSDGSAQKELETYLNSIQGRIDLFTNELQTFWMNLINSNVIKFIVNAGTTILEVLNNIMAIVDKFAEGWGSLGVIVPGVLAGIGTHIFKTKHDIKDMSGMIDYAGKGISNFFSSGKELYGSYVANFAKNMNSLSLASQGATQSILGSSKAGQMMSASWSALTATIGTTAASILGFVAVAGIAIAIVDALTTSHKEYVKQLEKETKDLAEVQTELKSVNNELKTTQDRISELENKGPLSFTEQAELDRLRALNDELERQQKLLEAKEKRERQEQIDTALNAVKTDKNLQDKYITDTSTVTYAPNTVSADVNNGKKIRAANTWEQNLNALEGAQKNLDEAEQKLLEAEESKMDKNSKEYKQLANNVESAEERVSSLNSTIDQLNTDWQAEYGKIGFIENATTEQEKAWNEHFSKIQDYINRQAFINGDISKADALNSAFGAYASNAAQSFKEEFEAAIKEGRSPEQVLKELFTSNREYASLLNNLSSAYNIDTSDIIGFFTQTGDYADSAAGKIATTVTSLDKLTASVEAYKSAQQIVNTITHDGQAISEDYYNTLKEQLADVMDGSEDFSDAIDTSNGYIVKNVSLLNRLTAQSKKNQQATIRVAKAQAQLKYKDLIQKMRSSIIYMGANATAYGFISQAMSDNQSIMDKQLESLKQTVQQYALLELALTNAGTAYTEFEQAKERDAQLTYDESMLEMLKVIDEGLLKNEAGTEAFEFAVKAIVPEKFWKDIDDVDEKIKSIHDYIDGDNTFARFFYVDEESGELDITTDNVREFVDLCIESGLFDGNSKNFALNDSVEGIETFAEKLGVTEPVILAMLTALEKVDATWGNILTEATMTPFDRKVNATAQEMATLNQQYADGTIGLDEYIQKMAELDTKMDQYTDEATTKLLGSDNGTEDTSDDKIGYIEAHKKVLEAQADVDESTQKLIEAQKKYNAAIQGTDKEYIAECKEELEKTEKQLDDNLKVLDSTLKKRDELGKYPTQYEIEIAINDIDKEIEKFGTKFDGALKEYFVQDSNGLWVVNTEMHADANLADLEKKYPGITEYIKLLNSKTELQAFADTTSAEDSTNALKATVDGVIQAIEENLITLDLDEEAVNNIVEQTNKILSGIATEIGVVVSTWLPDWLKTVLGWLGFGTDNSKKSPVYSDASKAPSSAAISGSRSTTSGGTPYYRNKKTGNTIYAEGSDGLKTDEHNAIVGELGEELVCDIDKGVYYTVGSSGTEMVNLPKNAIIYNHKQTEELLKTGKTSRGTLTGGLSFASGNAYAGISHGIPSYHPNLKDETSFANYLKLNTKWDDAASTLLHSADTLSDASDDVSDAFEDTINWIEVLFTRIDNAISEQELILELQKDNVAANSTKAGIYDNIFGQYYNKYSNSVASANYYRAKAEAEMAGLPADIQAKIRSGSIDIQEFKFNKSTEGLTEEQKKAIEKEQEAFEKYVEKIQTAIEYYDQVSTYTQQAYQTMIDIDAKAKEQFDDTSKAYENEIALNESLKERYAALNELAEAKESFGSEVYLKEQIGLNNTILEQQKDQRAAMQANLDLLVAQGKVKIGTDTWYEMVEAIYDVDDAIIETQIEIENLQNDINDLHWDKFDELMNRFGYIKDEIDNVITLISHHPDGLIMEELADLTTDNWANKNGITTLGLYAQEMERAMYASQQYAAELKYLEETKADYNETEYLAKKNELLSAQYAEIENYYDAKEGILELNEARVDAIKDGIEKEIEAYDELIQKKKELLEQDRDLHDFQNDISDKEKEVSKIRKQLAAMDGDDTAATTAKKKKLEEELVDAQKALEESYYDHAMTSRQEALDKEFTAFETEKNKEIATWEEWLTKTEIVVEEALQYVKGNTEQVYGTLTQLGYDYGITLSQYLTEPWKKGEEAISAYGYHFGPKVDYYKQYLKDKIDEAKEHSDGAALAAQTYFHNILDQSQTKFSGVTSAFSTALDGVVLKWQQTSIEIDKEATKQVQSAQRAAAAIAGINSGSSNFVDRAVDKSLQQFNDLVQNGGKTYGSSVTPTPTYTPTPTPAPAPAPTIKVGGKINAGSASIYEHYSLPGTANTQYYKKDPVYIVLEEATYKGVDWVKVRHHKLSKGVTGWFKKSQVKASYAQGTLGTKKDEWALIDELGDELLINTDGHGRLSYLSKGTGVVPADLTEKLMNIALDPSSALDGIVPKARIPSVTANNFDVNLSFDSLVHVDNASKDTVPELQKMVRTEFNNMMKQVNNGLKRTGRA